jgi:hypothetical protein
VSLKNFQHIGIDAGIKGAFTKRILGKNTLQ